MAVKHNSFPLKIMRYASADQANQVMVDRLIAEGALWSPNLIAAFRATPRHHFLDHVYQFSHKQERWRRIPTRHANLEELRLIYSDRALITRLSPAASGREVPISSSSQPSLMAQMLQDLHLQPGLKALEIGAGTGYNAALLAHVLGPDRVWTVDVDREVLTGAWNHLERYADRRIHLRHADGRQGLAEEAPFDRIMVTAATEDLEPAWLEQLSRDGILLAPLYLAPGLAYVVRGTVREGVFDGRLMRAAYFMPLRAEGETGASELPPWPEAAEQRAPAPWAGWFNRGRPRIPWLGFVQALAFLGYLRGLDVHYRTLGNGQPVYGVSVARQLDAPHPPTCWLGQQEWQFNDDDGCALAQQLWTAFLDAGGPWPTEFRLQADPAARLTLPPTPSTYERQGPRCQHVWQLISPRDRGAWL